MKMTAGEAFVKVLQMHGMEMIAKPDLMRASGAGLNPFSAPSGKAGMRPRQRVL